MRVAEGVTQLAQNKKCEGFDILTYRVGPLFTIGNFVAPATLPPFLFVQ